MYDKGNDFSYSKEKTIYIEQENNILYFTCFSPITLRQDYYYYKLCMYILCTYIHCTMAGSRIIMIQMQTLMLSEWFPILTRLIVTEPSLSLTVLLPISNCMVTMGAIAAVNWEENYVLYITKLL